VSEEVDPDLEELAKAAYEAMEQSIRGGTGLPPDSFFPGWNDDDPYLKENWQVVARSVRDRLCQQNARDNLPARRPKCRDCRWWEWRKGDSMERGQRLGLCERENLSGNLTYMIAGSADNYDTFLETTEDFGCILWKAKDGVPTFHGIPIKMVQVDTALGPCTRCGQPYTKCLCPKIPKEFMP
jgi:hypothetical protein